MTDKEMCKDCGEQEAIVVGASVDFCQDCLDAILQNNRDGHRGGDDGYDWGEPDDTPSLCHCEDRPCCGC